MIAAVTAPHQPGDLHTLEPTPNRYGYLAGAGLAGGSVVDRVDVAA